MTPRLGLVCITTSSEVRYRTVTRKRLLDMVPAAQRKLLDGIYRDNIQTFDGALRFCKREGISLYRIPSGIFPFADEAIGRGAGRTGRRAGALGRHATELGIRLVMHPDQFVVLSSDSPDVVANSVKILQRPVHAAGSGGRLAGQPRPLREHHEARFYRDGRGLRRQPEEQDRAHLLDAGIRRAALGLSGETATTGSTAPPKWPGR
jgi:hypothetical protein